jgi:hypothetical protein
MNVLSVRVTDRHDHENEIDYAGGKRGAAR